MLKRDLMFILPEVSELRCDDDDDTSLIIGGSEPRYLLWAIRMFVVVGVIDTVGVVALLVRFGSVCVMF
jgi:hypothetical protein